MKAAGYMHVFNPHHEWAIGSSYGRILQNMRYTKENYPGTNAWFITGNLDFGIVVQENWNQLSSTSKWWDVFSYKYYEEGNKRTKFQEWLKVKWEKKLK
jgi:putative N6-adenine-specific DNA methylase